MGPEVIMLSLIGLCAIGIYLALKYQQKIKQQAELAWNDKYGNSPIVGHNQSGKIVLRSRQVAELSSTEQEEFDERDAARDRNIIELRLVLEDLIEELDEEFPPEEEEEESSLEVALELRQEWIEENEEQLDEHSNLVGQEEIGIGISVVEETNDEEIDKRLEREGGKSGQVQISLTWDDYNDLDLHVYAPSGERIYFNNRMSECGGILDVDMNVKPKSDSPVENVVWENAPPGRYKVGVHFYKHHRKRGTKKTCDYKLRVLVHGESKEYHGQITYGRAMQMVTSFTIEEPQK